MDALSSLLKFKETNIIFTGCITPIKIFDNYHHKLFEIEIDEKLKLRVDENHFVFARKQWCNIPSMAKYEWLDKNYKFVHPAHNLLALEIKKNPVSISPEQIYHLRSETNFCIYYTTIINNGCNEKMDFKIFINSKKDPRPATIFVFDNYLCLGFIQSFINIGIISVDQELEWEKHLHIIWVPTKLTPHLSFPIHF